MKSHRYDPAKRILDVIVATLALVVLAPLMAVVAVTVAAALGRPVLFRQQRPGRDGRPFVLVKFRTMRAVDDAAGLISDADRMTPTGLALRSMSLDELPTLWNVMRGEMSLVGPRPLLMCYLSRYTPAQARRHEVRPGVTGLAQVRGRNLLCWEDKFRFDVWYVDHRSFGTDLRILAATARVVVGRSGITADGETTAPEFLGSPTDSHW